MSKEEREFDLLVGSRGTATAGAVATAEHAAAEDDDSFCAVSRKGKFKKKRKLPSAAPQNDLSSGLMPPPPAPRSPLQNSDPFAFSCAESEDDTSLGSAVEGHRILKAARLKKKRLKGKSQRSSGVARDALNERHTNRSGGRSGGIKKANMAQRKKKRRQNA